MPWPVEEHDGRLTEACQLSCERELPNMVYTSGAGVAQMHALDLTLVASTYFQTMIGGYILYVYV